MLDLHIILDIDGTLIAETTTYHVVPRPFLQTFLEFCFFNFKSVSIWTAAKREWYDFVYSRVLSEIIEPKGWKFRTVFTGERCTLVLEDEINEFYDLRVTIKRLRKIWKKYDDMDQTNTLILDDNPVTYKKNYGNGIPIKTYAKNTNDYEFLKLMIWLKNFTGTKDVRRIEKRHWSGSISLESVLDQDQNLC